MKLKKTLLILSILSNIFLGSSPGVSAGLSNEIQLERWPVNGEVILSFGTNDSHNPKFHHGIDISAEPGTTIISPVKGKVFFAGFTPAGGGTISILTPSGYRVTLLQLEKIFVKKEMLVEPGTEIGMVASFGDKSSSEPHLHLGLIDPQGNYLDPLPLLPPLSINSPTDRRDFAVEGPPVPVSIPEIAYQESSLSYLAKPLTGWQSNISVIEGHAHELEIDGRKQASTFKETINSLEAERDLRIPVTFAGKADTVLNFHRQLEESSTRRQKEKIPTSYPESEKTKNLQISNLDRISGIKYNIPGEPGSGEKRGGSSLISKIKYDFPQEPVNEAGFFPFENRSIINYSIRGVIALMSCMIISVLSRMLLKTKAGVKALRYCFSH